MCVLLPSGREMLERHLIFMTDTFSLYCQSAGTKVHSWLESASPLHVSSHDLTWQIRRAGLKCLLRAQFFFSGSSMVTRICHGVACILSSHSASYQKSTPDCKDLNPIISLQNKDEKTPYIWPYVLFASKVICQGEASFLCLRH